MARRGALTEATAGSTPPDPVRHEAAQLAGELIADRAALPPRVAVLHSDREVFGVASRAQHHPREAEIYRATLL